MLSGGCRWTHLTGHSAVEWLTLHIRVVVAAAAVLLQVAVYRNDVARDVTPAPLINHNVDECREQKTEQQKQNSTCDTLASTYRLQVGPTSNQCGGDYAVIVSWYDARQASTQAGRCGDVAARAAAADAEADGRVAPLRHHSTRIRSLDD